MTFRLGSMNLKYLREIQRSWRENMIGGYKEENKGLFYISGERKACNYFKPK